MNSDHLLNTRAKKASWCVFGLAALHMIYYVTCMVIGTAYDTESSSKQLDIFVFFLAITLLLFCIGYSIRCNNRLGLSIWALVIFGLHFFAGFILVATNILGGERAPLEVIIFTGLLSLCYAISVVLTYRTWKSLKKSTGG